MLQIGQKGVCGSGVGSVQGLLDVLGQIAKPAHWRLQIMRDDIGKLVEFAIDAREFSVGVLQRLRLLDALGLGQSASAALVFQLGLDAGLVRRAHDDDEKAPAGIEPMDVETEARTFLLGIDDLDVG